MKTAHWITLGMVLVVAAGAQAQVGGVGTILKDKARGFTNNAATRGTEQQPLMPTKAKTTRPAGTAAPVKPVVAEIPKLTDAQLAAARKLRADLDEIKSKSTPTANQTQTVMQDLLKTAQGKTPGLSTLTKLAGDLTAGWPNQTLDDKEKEQFTGNLVQLLNSGGLPSADSQKIIQNTELILKYSGMPNLDAQKILASLKTVVTQVK